MQVPNLLTVGFVGALSDAKGRNMALLCPLVTLMLSALAVALVPAGPVCLGGMCVDDGFWILLGARHAHPHTPARPTLKPS